MSAVEYIYNDKNMETRSKLKLKPETSPQIDLATAIDLRFANLGEFEIPETPRDLVRFDLLNTP
jgi:hypothetical protein